MSQPHGRYPGSRDKGPRQSRQPSKTTSHRQNKPYVKTPPARDPAQTASIFKTRSFKWLVDAVGAENIALGLDSNLSRVAELINGERFTPETAFHIETTLGLPDGFFDQPNPSLPSETIRRLKAPLDFVRAHAEPEFDDAPVTVPTPSTPATHLTSTGRLSLEPEMPKKIDGRSPQTATKSNPVEAKPASPAASKAASAKAKASMKRGAQQSLPLNEEVPVHTIRRANLHVLTSRKGTKVRLATVIGISASNLDNRLYGQKRMDDTEASRFTERLGLPAGWLDVPRAVEDIPQSVSDLLDPQAGRAAASQPEHRAAARRETKPADKVEKTVTEAAAQAAETDHSQDATVPQEVEVVEQQEPVATPAADLTISPAVANDVPTAVAHQQPAPVPLAEVVAEPRRAAPATSLDDLVGIAPIAEALIKTLAGKARTGRLDEMKALELLRQIVSL